MCYPKRPAVPKFAIESTFQPKGDQPEAIDALVANLVNGEAAQVLLGIRLRHRPAHGRQWLSEVGADPSVDGGMGLDQRPAPAAFVETVPPMTAPLKVGAGG